MYRLVPSLPPNLSVSRQQRNPQEDYSELKAPEQAESMSKWVFGEPE